MSSYRDINYALRPAKAVERKMLCEAFRRLYPFGNIDAYRYVDSDHSISPIFIYSIERSGSKTC